MKYTWINGNYIESSQASLHIDDLAIQRGYGVFDFFRCHKGIPFLIPWYLDRFFNSAAGLNLVVPISKDELANVIQQFISKNHLVEEGVKMILTGGYSPDSYTPLEPNLVISTHRINLPAKEKYVQGFRVMTHEYQRESPATKSINYLQGIQLAPVLKARGLDDVLYHWGGVVTEFPRSNIFMLDSDDRLITPTNNILSGITRRTVLHLAKGHYSNELRDISIKELINAKEVFLTSTTKRIMPVAEIDGCKIGTGSPGMVSQHLTELLNHLSPEFSIPK